MSRPILAVAGFLAAQAIAGGLNQPLPPAGVFDYIVVGGGPSGLTIANRLTEDPNIQVLLLEAGDPDQYEDKIMIPAFQGMSGFENGQCGGYNWCDNTVAQTNLNNRVITIPQGRGLGGGTLINAMLWNRGDTQDYDTWAALGNEGWDFNGMLPYFQKSETFTPEPNTGAASAYGIGENTAIHGTSGPQNVTFPTFKYTPSQNFFEAMKKMGIPTQTDAANPSTKGAMFLPQGISPWNQSRADARRMRFDPVQGRANFWISTGQHVQRVLFEGGCAQPGPDGLRAVGVEVSQGPGLPIWTPTANREVILSAGAIRSPQLLELSGIGDTNILNGLGLNTRVSAPGVGNNLQDHMLMRMGQAFNNQSYVYSNILNNQTINAAARSLYYTNRTGPYTFGPPDGNAFLAMPQFSKRAAHFVHQARAQGVADYLAPGLDPAVIEGYSRQRDLLIPALNDKSRGCIEFLQDNAGNTQISNMRPLTRGSTHAVNTDPFTYPALDMRYASNPVDYEFMFDALRWNDDLFQQPSIQIMQPNQFAPPHAGSDDVFRNFMNNSLGTEFHPAGTAAMLPQKIGGVVDSNLLVYGTTNLRVVDASIQPIIPASHMESVCYAVAEKAADIIKAAQANGSSRKVPTMPLDQTACTVPGRRAAVKPRSANDYAPNNVHYRRQNPLPLSSYAGSTVPTNVGGYPDYSSSQADNAPAASGVPDRASHGLPSGAGLEFGTKLIGCTEGTVDGALANIAVGFENTTTSLLDVEPLTDVLPKMARSFKA